MPYVQLWSDAWVIAGEVKDDYQIGQVTFASTVCDWLEWDCIRHLTITAYITSVLHILQ